MQLRAWTCDHDQLRGLILRADLAITLVRQQIEEELTTLVALPPARIEELLASFKAQHGLEQDAALESWLLAHDWQAADLKVHVCRPEAIRVFSKQRFGPGLEELFLNRKSDLDTAVYSLLRVRQAGLARELWIQLSEGEITFAEAAARFSEGPEATTKGVIGPVTMGQLQPQLAQGLLSLQVGELRAPEVMGEWHVLLRLEQLTPARLDEAMQERLLMEQFQAWIQERANAILTGEPVDPLHYDQPHESG